MCGYPTDIGESSLCQWHARLWSHFLRQARLERVPVHTCRITTGFGSELVVVEALRLRKTKSPSMEIFVKTRCTWLVASAEMSERIQIVGTE